MITTVSLSPVNFITIHSYKLIFIYDENLQDPLGFLTTKRNYKDKSKTRLWEV